MSLSFRRRIVFGLVAAAHGRTVRVHDAQPHGAAFVVSLPEAP